jgi:Stress responsive A/B Barrel Domain
MFIHMFLFRLKAGVTEAQKDRMVSEIAALQKHIPQVLDSYVGRNVSPRAQGYELGGAMKFADQPAFEEYNAHPVHQELLKWLLPLIDPIELDFPVA